jgi:hypothetical protein
MHHLYILASDLSLTKNVMHELRAKGIPKAHIHIVGERSDILENAGLNEANLIQTTDLVPSIKRGAIMGVSLVILLCSMYCYIVYKHDLVIQPFILMGLVAVGIAMGAWGSSLIGINLKNPFVEKFKGYVKHGSYIMIVDSHNDDEKQVIISGVTKHPELKWATDEDLVEKFGPPQGD